jgi:hypothetical protein
MADTAHCTLNPRHTKRVLETPTEQRQGYCADCAEELAASERIAEKNARIQHRQDAKDAFIAAHPELSPGVTFDGEAEWLAYAEQEGI